MVWSILIKQDLHKNTCTAFKGLEKISKFLGKNTREISPQENFFPLVNSQTYMIFVSNNQMCPSLDWSLNK